MSMTFVSGGTTVTLRGTKYPFSQPKRRIQNRGETADGSAKVYNFDVDLHYVDLVLAMSAAEESDLRSFFETTVDFSLTEFTFTPESGMDLGNGDGGAVLCHLWQDDFDPPQVSPGRFETSIRLKITGTPP